MFQAQPQPAGLRFVIWQGDATENVELCCIIKKTQLPADNKLDGRKKTSPNPNIRE